MRSRDRLFFDAGVAFAKRHIKPIVGQPRLVCNTVDNGRDGNLGTCIREVGHLSKSHESHDVGVCYWPNNGECETTDDAFNAAAKSINAMKRVDDALTE